MRTQSDERLVDLVRAGNPGAFDAIVALPAPFAASLPEDPARGPGRGRGPTGVAERSPRTPPVRGRDAAVPVAVPHRAQRFAQRAARPLAGHVELDETIDGVERPDQAFEKSQKLRDTVAAVKGLPERQRSAIVLRELEGRSYEEIAGSLGVSDGSVRMLLNRARATMQAGVTAVTPFGLLVRLPFATGGPRTARAPTWPS